MKRFLLIYSVSSQNKESNKTENANKNMEVKTVKLERLYAPATFFLEINENDY